MRLNQHYAENESVFFPGYMTGEDRELLEQRGKIIETQWDAWHFIPNKGNTTKVMNGAHYLIITNS